MINYIQHDQEFYGVVKLTSGEELLGPMIATDDHGDTLIFVSNPAKPHPTPVNDNKGNQGLAIGFTKWMMFSEKDFYLIREPDVICVAPMSDESIAMYRMWLRREYGGPEEGYKAPVNESMGLIGRVDDFRKKLEKQWRNTG